jgi:predicted metal-binding membrane protein
MAQLERRVTLATIGVLLALAAIAWALTVRQAVGMSTMATGLGQVGARMPLDLTAPLFLSMWLSMMVAMMFPTIAPMVLAHRAIVRKRGEGWAPTVSFVLGYLTVWAAIGLIPLAALVAVRSVAPLAESPPQLVAASGAILLLAGGYQFTRWKTKCLKACRTPFGFILDHDFGAGSQSAFLAGIAHGAYCLGCCWALMAVLVVVGVMNLVWMVALALVFLAEKNWRHGALLTRVAGTLVAGLGLAVLVHPELLTWLSGGSPPSVMGGHM